MKRTAIFSIILVSCSMFSAQSRADIAVLVPTSNTDGAQESTTPSVDVPQAKEEPKPDSDVLKIEPAKIEKPEDKVVVEKKLPRDAISGKPVKAKKPDEKIESLRDSVRDKFKK